MVLSGEVYVYQNDADYNIGKLRSNLPSYDPTNAAMKTAGYTLNDMKNRWSPRVYEMMGSAISAVVSSGAVITSGGTIQPACAANGYTPRESGGWTLVSWYWTAVSAGTGGGDV